MLSLETVKKIIGVSGNLPKGQKFLIAQEPLINSGGTLAAGSRRFGICLVKMVQAVCKHIHIWNLSLVTPTVR